MALLEHIDSPADIRNLSDEELRTLCAELRQYIIECCAENPGHIGSSLGAVEIAVAVHKVFDTPEDHLIWDVGHQAYAHKILTGRREAFRNNRKLDGLSGFPKRSESPYDAFGTGHSSTSISAALGMAVADKLQGRNRHTIAVIGDGAMTGGLAFEGLNNAGSLKTDLLVILNDNQISIDHNTGALHNYLVRFTTSQRYNRLKRKVWNTMGEGHGRSFLQRVVKGFKRTLIRHQGDTINLFDAMGFRYIGPIDGNDIVRLTHTLERIKELHGPILLHVITTKGKGYAPAEENQTLWHAPGTFDPKTGKRTGKSSDRAKFQEVFGSTLVELARRDPRIVGITPAMLTGCSLDLMMKEMPERTFDVGIAEQHAVTFSAGLAAEKMLPFCNIYSTFSQRALDNVIHDVALQNLKIVLCLDRAGLVGEDGATHHGSFDLALYRPVPNLTVAAPMDEDELRQLMYSAAQDDYEGPVVIRYPRGCGNGTPWRDTPFRFIPRAEARKLHEGAGIAVLSIGTAGVEAAEAVRKASEAGIEVLHYDMRFLKPIDEKALAEACGKARHLITVEDGTLIGGLHGAVAEYLSDHALPHSLTPFGIPDRFIEQGKPAELHRLCGFDADHILQAIFSLSAENS